MWTTKERGQICVNAMKRRKSISKVFYYRYRKLEKKNVYVSKMRKSSW